MSPGRSARTAGAAALALGAGLVASVALGNGDPAARAATEPAAQRLTVVEHLGERIPTGLRFTDSEGQPRALKELVGQDRPVVLTLVYYRCSSLCHLVLGGMVKALRQTGLTLGKDYDAVTVSIDPEETPAHARERRRGFLQALGVPESQPGWTFLTGGAEEVKALADAVGFGFRKDPVTKEFTHPAVAFVLTPDGRVSRYLYGVTFPPRDVRLTLVEASGGRVGTTLDRILLTCMRYDPASRRYGAYVRGVLQGGGMLVFVGVAITLGALWRRELRRGGKP